MTQTSQDFYKNLEELEELKNISNTSSYKILPNDWYIAVTDVKGSTKAIEQGHYKDVNMVGALTIISILNLNRSLDIPFVFGGDGSFVLIPPTYVVNVTRNFWARTLSYVLASDLFDNRDCSNEHLCIAHIFSFPPYGDYRMRTCRTRDPR